MNCLFIGGPADGQWREVEATIDKVTELVVVVIINRPKGKSRTYKYFRQIIRHFDVEYHIYVWAYVPDRSIMEMILKGYEHQKYKFK